MACPLDCEYLQEARKHERAPEIEAEQVPNREIRVSEKFLERNANLIGETAKGIAGTALATPGAVDQDARQAIEALIRTYRTLESGVYYETRPENPLAMRIYAGAQEAIGKFREAERERLGMAQTRDSDVLGCLVFLQRLELGRNNGRPRSRAFLDAMRGFYEAASTFDETPGSSLILP